MLATSRRCSRASRLSRTSAIISSTRSVAKNCSSLNLLYISLQHRKGRQARSRSAQRRVITLVNEAYSRLITVAVFSHCASSVAQAPLFTNFTPPVLSGNHSPPPQAVYPAFVRILPPCSYHGSIHFPFCSDELILSCTISLFMPIVVRCDKATSRTVLGILFVTWKDIFHHCSQLIFDS